MTEIMTDEQKRLKEHFLEPETRCGHYVSSETKALWKSMLDMVEEVDRICRKHNLKYFLIAGSLLGAIRHKGFIPWDDDFDIALFREDYNKLERILPKELPSNMFMQTLATDPGYCTPHMKIRLLGTTAIQDFAINQRFCFNMGIFIDIFALDGIPKFKFFQKILNYFSGRITDIVIYHNIRRKTITKREKIKKILYKLICFFIRPKLMHRLRESIYSLVKIHIDGECIQNPGVWGYDQKYRYKTIDLLETIDVPVEYLVLKVPSNYEKILTDIYGNWHKFVKGDSAHNIVDISCTRDYRYILKEKYGYTDEELR